MKSLQTSFPTHLDVTEGSSFQAMMKEYERFIVEGKNHAAFAFWCAYLEMVENIILFIRATWEGNWNFHLAAIRVLSPLMFAYDKLLPLTSHLLA